MSEWGWREWRLILLGVLLAQVGRLIYEVGFV